MKRKLIAFFAMACLLISSMGSMAVMAQDLETAPAAETTVSSSADTATPELTTPTDSAALTAPAATTDSTTTDPAGDSGSTDSATSTDDSKSEDSATTDPATEETVDCSGKFVNIALVVDVTGSMDPYIKKVRDNLTAFVKEIAKSGAIPRIALIEYQDYLYDGEKSTRVHSKEDYSVWFNDADQIVAEIATLKTGNGGDIPESLIDALGYVVSDDVMTFNKYAAKFAIVVTDAGYKDSNRWGITGMDEMIGLLKAKGIQTTVVTNKDRTTSTYDSDIDKYLRDEKSILLSKEYAALTEQTGGTIIDMTDDFAKELSKYAKRIIADTAKVEVDKSYVPVEKIALGSDVSVATAGVYKFPVTITPENATVKDIIWTVKDKEIATINSELTNSEYCVVNAVKEGTTQLIAKTADGGHTAYFTLTITDIVVDGAKATTCKVDRVAGILRDPERTTVTFVSDETKGVVIAPEILKEIFGALKDTPDKELTLAFTDPKGDELYSWTFSSGTMRDAGITVGSFKITDAAVVDIDKTIADSGVSADYRKIHFDHEGELPGTATIKTKTDLTGDKIYLYYYNPATKKLELVSSDVKVEGGCARFAIEHCSDYVISNAPITQPEKPKSPDTGE